MTCERGITHDVTFEAWANLVYSTNGDAGVSLAGFRKNVTIELYNLQGVKVRAWNVFRCWVSEFDATPEFDANSNAVAIEKIVFQNEGFERDQSVGEVAET